MRIDMNTKDIVIQDGEEFYIVMETKEKHPDKIYSQTFKVEVKGGKFIIYPFFANIDNGDSEKHPFGGLNWGIDENGN